MSARSCPECGVANDDTRVFCSDCGTRLPAVGSPTQSAASSGEKPAAPAASLSAPALSAPPLPQVKKKPIRTLSKSSGGSPWGGLFSNILLTAVLAAILAAVIQMARTPDHIPPPVPANSSAAKETFETLKEMAASNRPGQWTLNTSAANQYLATTIAMKPDDGGGLKAQFQRTFVVPAPNRVTLGVEQVFLGRPIYLLLTCEPEASADGTTARLVAGSIGRLPIHPLLLPAFKRVFEPVLTGLAPALELLRQANSVTLTPEDAALEWSGSAQKSR